MISVQRLILLNILLNLLLPGIIAVIWVAPASFTGNPMPNQELLINDSNKYETSLVSNETIYGGSLTENPVSENRVGNPLSLGLGIFDFLGKAIPKWALLPNDFDKPIEIYLAWIILTFRGILFLLLAIEIYFIIINKKST